MGFVLNASVNGLLLSAPAVLIAGAGIDTMQAGFVVSAGGALGALCVILAGWRSDRHGDRLGLAFAFSLAVAASLLLLAADAGRGVVIFGYLLFAASVFTTGMLMICSWADVLHVSELAVGGAAINTIWQIGNFASPYAWGLAKDATGGFRAGLLGAAVLAIALALIIRHARARVMARRRALDADTARTEAPHTP